MFALLPRRGSRLPAAARNACARLARLAAVLTAVTCGLLASAAIPAAWARPDPPHLPAYVPPVPATPSRVVITGGMAGWQVTLIALGAAVLAAVAAVIVDRTLATRRSAPASTT
jgi:hypothetical protein